MTPLCHDPDGTTRTGPPPLVVFPGSFNPLHDGHTALAEVAAIRTGRPVAFEISTANVDKPDLPADEVARRVAQFRGYAPVWVTRAATFAAKAELFPGATFVVGFDTAVRLVDAKYYGGEPARDAALRALLAGGCSVLVGGRLVGEAFRVWQAALVGEAVRELFVPLQEADFRRDRSSTELRNQR